jgi:uncharacterized protein YceK
MRNIWMLLICTLALGCSPVLGTTDDTQLGQPFTLEPGRVYVVHDQPAWNLEFVRVVQDSRCPKTAVCVWAGDAELEFRVSQGGEQQLVRLHSGLQSQSVVVMGYRLTLTQLDPEPDIGVTPAYRATLMLEKP